ncbi:MAG: hypothetical protein QXG00_03630 [Candidatus Woesearchaeota archaeon]
MKINIKIKNSYKIIFILASLLLIVSLILVLFVGSKNKLSINNNKNELREANSIDNFDINPEFYYNETTYNQYGEEEYSEYTDLNQTGLIHIMFIFADYYEPTKQEQLTPWVIDYPKMASKHKDADGNYPKHTWFLSNTGKDRALFLKGLSNLAYAGYGEIELDFHHGTKDDTNKDNTEITRGALNLYLNMAKKYGAMITAEVNPQTRFGFFHGYWALDNSYYDNWTDPSNPVRRFCGVNEELKLLRELGVYADFTFPAWRSMEPKKTDSIFYVKDDADPKSYDKPQNLRDVEVGKAPFGDIMIIEGPKMDNNIEIYEGENAVIVNPPTIQRMDQWVSHKVSVKGKPDWIFIKVHTQSARSIDSPRGKNVLVGQIADKFFTDIEDKYNDGINYKLHYVTAREAYNIIKAAEAGMTGDPNNYRDYIIKPYANTKIKTNALYTLQSYSDLVTVIKIIDKPMLELKSNETLSVEFKDYNQAYQIQESDDGFDWLPSDAQKKSTPNLQFTDTTPSIYYRITK